MAVWEFSICKAALHKENMIEEPKYLHTPMRKDLILILGYVKDYCLFGKIYEADTTGIETIDKMITEFVEKYNK